MCKASVGINADYCDLSVTAQLRDIPVCKIDDINDAGSINFLSQLQPDYLICVGWSQLLTSNTLKIAKIDNIGYHPSVLPLIVVVIRSFGLLALGLEKTASTFFHWRLNLIGQFLLKTWL